MFQQYSLLIVPFVALIATQLIKVIIDSAKGRFDWKDFDSYGGMPSSHASFLAAAFVTSWIQFGLKSPVTAIIAIISFVVLRDAVGLRMMVGDHAERLNKLFPDLKPLETRVGHTYAQIIVGLIIGTVIAVVL